MGLGHPEDAGRLALEVEFDQHRRRASDDPPVMPRLNRHDLRSLELHHTAVGILNVDLTLREKSHMGVHAQLRADDRFHVGRPAEASRVHQAFDPRGAGAADLELDAGDLAAVGAPHRRERSIGWRGCPARARLPELRVPELRDPGSLLAVLT
jgi:hypothetical protein